MRLTRRGLLGWLSALTGAAAVAKVAPAEADGADRLAAFESAVRSGPLSKATRAAGEAIEAERPVFKLLETTAGPVGAGDGYLGTETVTYPMRKACPAERGTPAEFAKAFGTSGVRMEHGLTLEHSGAAWALNPAREGQQTPSPFETPEEVVAFLARKDA